jgi:radical SAM protein with 4Fe4S-binding SPASM domain
MTREIFDKATDDLPPGTMILNQFHGESLLHPDFEYFLSECKRKFLRVSMPASGSAGFHHISALVGKDTPVYILIMSIDGACEYSQSARRGSITLGRVESFVDECLRARRDRKTPWIAVRWVEGQQSEREFELYLKHWLFEKKVDFILRSKMFDYGNAFNSPVSLGKSKCHSLLEGNPVVLFNGDVLLCERVPDRERYVIGNILKDSWDTIFARRAKLVGDYPNDKPCRLCSAAYLLTGMKGVVMLNHPESKEQEVPIYTHWDHSQQYFSLTKNWSGINWALEDK